MPSTRPPRESGVLLHPTSLPGPHGIGDLGDEAHRWLEFLSAGKQSLWQIMPLGPPGYGESPYAARSAFAGNALLISLERLAEDGLLEPADLGDPPGGPQDRVDFAAVSAYKRPRLRWAFRRFQTGSALKTEYEQFVAENAGWLDDFALFMALREVYGGGAWNEWPAPLVHREPVALAAARREHVDSVELARFTEFIFWRQWRALKAEANACGIRIVGDIPIFVAHDSADVWANQEIFYLDQRGQPTVVAGVPPDYFSPTGQRWGNPLYRWNRLAADGYRWWVERFRTTLTLVDLVRIDHFRGFEAYWEVPAREETALHGRWVKGPGAAFFDAVTAALGRLPVIVEDLGLITPAVHALREQLGYPGMKVLQFAFGDDAANPYLTHNDPDENCVVFTGTHDNDTTEGWWDALAEDERIRVIRYAGPEHLPISFKLTRMALASVARTAIVPLQDVLGLGNEARMNTPGRGEGNWAWRATTEQLDPEGAVWLAELTSLYNRYAGDRKHDEKTEHGGRGTEDEPADPDMC
jgi:4-alpha-glucanotransferase